MSLLAEVMATKRIGGSVGSGPNGHDDGERGGKLISCPASSPSSTNIRSSSTMSYDVPLASLAPFELVKADEGGVVLEQRPVDQSASSGGTQLPPLVYTLEPVGGSTLRVRLGRKGSDGVMENGLKRELAEGNLEGLKVRLCPLLSCSLAHTDTSLLATLTRSPHLG